MTQLNDGGNAAPASAFASSSGSSSAMPDNLRHRVRELIEYDDARESAPGEHTGTLGAAGAFTLCALRADSRLGAVAFAMVAGALLMRAASGRDGLRSWAGAAAARPVQVPTRSPGADAAADQASGAQLYGTPGV
ncbi:MAG TPA: hypothetical protein VLK29_02710 [Luteimonas sp.]|nr:hypothetical protein [Luteimonas sp.]